MTRSRIETTTSCSRSGCSNHYANGTSCHLFTIWSFYLDFKFNCIYSWTYHLIDLLVPLRHHVFMLKLYIPVANRLFSLPQARVCMAFFKPFKFVKSVRLRLSCLIGFRTSLASVYDYLFGVLATHLYHESWN